MSDAVFDVDVFAAAGGETLGFADGVTILVGGGLGQRAYVVKRGRVEIRHKGRTTEILSRGEMFGELSLLDGEPRVASAVAVGPVELVAIDRPLFQALLRDDPDFALAVINRLARRLRSTCALLDRCTGEAAPDLRVVASA